MGGEGGRLRRKDYTIHTCIHVIEYRSTCMWQIPVQLIGNISLSVAPPLMERSYQSIPNRILTAHTE